MGAEPSKIPDPAATEVLAARIRALEVSVGEQSKDYVYIQSPDTLTCDSQPAPPYSPTSRTVNVATSEQWEKELLQDPKVDSSVTPFTGCFSVDPS